MKDKVWEMALDLVDDRWLDTVKSSREQWKKEIEYIVDEIEELSYNAEKLAKESS